MVLPESERRNQTTKYGKREPLRPQLLVVKNAKYAHLLFHNFFYNFSPFRLTCDKTRL